GGYLVKLAILHVFDLLINCCRLHHSTTLRIMLQQDGRGLRNRVRPFGWKVINISKQASLTRLMRSSLPKGVETWADAAAVQEQMYVYGMVNELVNKCRLPATGRTVA
ncbi:hypothetical protein M8C21_007758, partial [Ambrosia artemisiifolia]